MEFQVKQLPASADKTTNKTIFNMQTPMPFTDGFVHFSTSVYKSPWSMINRGFPRTWPESPQSYKT